MTIPIKAYAATAPRASLEPFSYDPGELGPEEVEIKVTRCGICHSDLSMKEIAGSLDLIISTINVPLDIPGLLGTLAPKGVIHVVGAVLEPMQVPAFGLIAGQKSVAGSPDGSPSAIDQG
jgi:D-arabinose 1-dehydrogenase-like Zn-dependent alcohol dehydrogenase